jgi:catechol 2,3-dioxygenase-like lactoylglutathione lyase family enzyme
LTQPPTPTRPVIAAAEPQLFVADIKAACNFYLEKLGFSVVFTYGEPPYYGQVKRDRTRLNLRCVEAPVIDPTLRDSEELLSATMMVNTVGEIEQLFLEFKWAGVLFAQQLAAKPWGAKDFMIKDLDGNLLLFAGPEK